MAGVPSDISDKQSVNSFNHAGIGLFSERGSASGENIPPFGLYNQVMSETSSMKDQKHNSPPKDSAVDPEEENEFIEASKAKYDQHFEQNQDHQHDFLNQNPGLRSPANRSLFAVSQSHVAEASGLLSPVAELKTDDEKSEISKQELKSLVRRYKRAEKGGGVSFLGGGMVMPTKVGQIDVFGVEDPFGLPPEPEYQNHEVSTTQWTVKGKIIPKLEPDENDARKKFQTEQTTEETLNEAITLQLKPTALMVYDHILLSSEPVKKANIFTMIFQQLGIQTKGKKRERVQRATNGLMDCLVGLGIIKKTGTSKGLSQEFTPTKPVRESLIQEVKQTRDRLKMLQARKSESENRLKKMQDQYSLLTKIIARNKRSSQLTVMSYGFQFNGAGRASSSNLAEPRTDSQPSNRIPLSSFIFSCKYCGIKLKPSIEEKSSKAENSVVSRTKSEHNDTHHLIISSEKDIWTRPKRVIEIFAELVQYDRSLQMNKVVL